LTSDERGVPGRARFLSHLRVDLVPGEGVFLISERGSTVLTDPLSQRLAPFLHGRFTADEIAQRLADEVDPAEVYYALMELESKGHITTTGPAPPTPEAAFWHALGEVPSAASARFASTPVALRTFLDPAAGDARAAAGRLGLVLGEPGDVWLVLVDDYLHPALDEINRQALEERRPWLLARPVGTVLWIGPLFLPGEGACWRCLEHRLRRNRLVESFSARRRQEDASLAPTHPALASTFEAGVALAAAQLARWIGTGAGEHISGVIWTVDVTEPGQHRHAVARRPQCPACGDPELNARRVRQPVELEPRPAGFARDGGHRALSPEEFVGRHESLVDPLTGVAPFLRKLPAAHPAVHVYVSGPNAARPYRNLAHLRGDLRRNNSGKGMTDAQARASALGEAVERYSGAHQGDEPRVRASLDGLGGRAIHPNACMLFSDEQYRTRVEWNARNVPFARVPVAFDPEREMDWTPVWSLTRREHRYLPTAYLYYGHPEWPRGPCYADSNGCAAGATLEEAVRQGLLELVERDGVALWWYNRLRRPGVDLGALAAANGREVIEWYAASGRDVWALDLTSDLGVPTFAAVSRRTEAPTEDILFGFGAHLDPMLALTRALGEMNQMTLSAAAIEDAADDRDFLHRWLREVTVSSAPWLAPTPGPPKRLAEVPAPARADLRDEVECCRERLEARGLEVLVLDQTRADVGIPVARVLAPGIRHFWARLAPGRLYDVPVALGWLPGPLREADMNPTPVFL